MTQDNKSLDNPSMKVSIQNTGRNVLHDRQILNWNHLILGMKRTTKEFVENVLENIIESIIITDLDGHLIFFNSYSEKMFGFKADEVLGHHVTILGPKTPNVLKQIQKNKTFSGELTFKTKTGKCFPAYVRSVPLKDDKNKPVAMVGVARDLTREKEIEKLKEELFQSEKMSLIGTLASEVAHEINNPLGGLVISVQMLLEDIENDELDLKMAKEELLGIENDALRCRNITRKLLDFSRRKPEGSSPLDLNKLIEASLVFVQRQAEIENINFIKNYDHKLPLVWGNTNSLQQVMINLIKNACDAMPEGGHVIITTEVLDMGEQNPRIRISVEDTGPGIPREYSGMIFDSFFTTKEGGKGTGLGLAVSRRIVEEQGGKLTFENRKGKTGAVFHVLLPSLKVSTSEDTHG